MSFINKAELSLWGPLYQTISLDDCLIKHSWLIGIFNFNPKVLYKNRQVNK